MINPLTLPLAWLWQSNDFIAQKIRSGELLQPNWDSYTGFIGFFAKFFLIAILGIANGLGSLPYNFGFAIILTALLVRMMLLPLTRMQLTGMRNMQLLQPVMKEIQLYYPDKNEQSAKLMELYSAYKINPFSGCLPMLIMFPILFGVYRALYDPLFAGKDFFGIQLMFPVNVTSARSFGIGPDLADLVDITISEKGLINQVFRLPDTLPLIGGSHWYWPALILVVLYIVTTLLMQRAMRLANQPDPKFIAEFQSEMKRDKPSGAPAPPDPTAQMQRQMALMNIMLIFFAFIFSAGALLYFVTQNLIMLLEYKILLAVPGAVKLDAKEMKAFIRRPPPPPAAKGGAAPAAKTLPAARPANPPEPAEGHHPNDEETTEDDGQTAAEPQGQALLKRPRKKRRKS